MEPTLSYTTRREWYHYIPKTRRNDLSGTTDMVLGSPSMGVFVGAGQADETAVLHPRQCLATFSLKA